VPAAGRARGHDHAPTTSFEISEVSRRRREALADAVEQNRRAVLLSRDFWWWVIFTTEDTESWPRDFGKISEPS
jgi:hypothetical protein